MVGFTIVVVVVLVEVVGVVFVGCGLDLGCDEMYLAFRERCGGIPLWSVYAVPLKSAAFVDASFDVGEHVS